MSSLKAFGIFLIVCLVQFGMTLLGLFISAVWELSMTWTAVVTFIFVSLFNLFTAHSGVITDD